MDAVGYALASRAKQVKEVLELETFSTLYLYDKVFKFDNVVYAIKDGMQFKMYKIDLEILTLEDIASSSPLAGWNSRAWAQSDGDDKIYVWTLNMMYYYQVSTNTWGTRTLPIKEVPGDIYNRLLEKGIAYNGYIYTCGKGDDHYTTGSNFLIRYDCDANTTRQVATIGYLIASPQICEANDFIYVGGGREDTGSSTPITPINTFNEFNPSTLTLTSKANIPSYREDGIMTSFRGKVYAVGGEQSRNGNSNMSIDIYDPSTNAWEVTYDSNILAKVSRTGTHCGIGCWSDSDEVDYVLAGGMLCKWQKNFEDSINNVLSWLATR